MSKKQRLSIHDATIMKKRKRIRTLKQLQDAAQNKRAVICPWSRVWKKPRPAAFVINLSGHLLCAMFERGMYLY